MITQDEGKEDIEIHTPLSSLANISLKASL